jgi:hypothetical protein
MKGERKKGNMNTRREMGKEFERKEGRCRCKRVK